MPCPARLFKQMDVPEERLNELQAAFKMCAGQAKNAGRRKRECRFKSLSYGNLKRRAG